MNPRASLLLSQVVVVAAGIGAYHLVRSRGDRPAPESESVAPSGERPSDTLAPSGTATLATRTADLERRYAAILARLEALELRLIPASADAGGGGRVPSGVGERRETWTDEQIASLRAMMEEVEARRSMDRETASYRDLVRRVAPNLAPADESGAVSLVSGFMRTIRTLFAGGSAGNTEEERQATNAKAAAERTKLLKDLGAFLSKDVVERLAPHLPDFANPVGHTPPNKEAPVVPGMDPK